MWKGGVWWGRHACEWMRNQFVAMSTTLLGRLGPHSRIERGPQVHG